MLNKQIAGQLGVAEVTIKVHRHNVTKKMGVRTLADLVRLYEKLIQEKVPADLYILKGADHGDAMFTQESVKKLMLSFLDGILK